MFDFVRSSRTIGRECAMQMAPFIDMNIKCESKIAAGCLYKIGVFICMQNKWENVSLYLRYWVDVCFVTINVFAFYCSALW